MRTDTHYFPSIVGNDNLCQKMGGMIDSDKLSHAYILEGEEGFGKHTLAQDMIAALACEKRYDDGPHSLPCGRCPSCLKIKSGNSPDIRYINRNDKSTLGIDQIRFLKDDVRIAPMELPVKAYVIEDAQTMTIQAQNALLLTLEEPPAYVFFVLLCAQSDMLLETIKSRAPLCRLLPVARAPMLDFINTNYANKANAVSKDEMESIILSSHGSIGHAITLLDVKARKPIMEKRAFADSFVTACLTRTDSVRVVSLLNEFPSKREDICDQLLYINQALRDLLLLKKSENCPMLYYTDRESALTLSDQITIPKLLSLWNAIEDTRQSLLRNGNIKLCITQLGLKTNLLS